jgi:ZIP family zinc transporter
VLVYGFIPAATLSTGGLLALFYSPGARLRSTVQHFAAGLILAAVALELVPQFKAEGHFNLYLQGFAIGLVVMLVLDALPGLLGVGKGGDTVLGKMLIRRLPVFFDGLLVGTLLATGVGAFVLTFAISIEQTFVGLAAAAALVRLGKSGLSLFPLILLLASVLSCGMLLGNLVIGHMNEYMLHRVIGMATAIMLYVVVEEMLRDAHEEEYGDSVFMRLAFFGGFLLTFFLD